MLRFQLIVVIERDHMRSDFAERVIFPVRFRNGMVPKVANR